MAEPLNEIVKNKIANIESIKYDDIPSKSLRRIVIAEEIIQDIEENIKKNIKVIKENKLSISFFSDNEKMAISRRSIYSDKYLLSYLNESIKNQNDYFNEKKLVELEEKIKFLEERNEKIIDNIIDIFNLKKRCSDYELMIEELSEENKNLRLMIEEQRKKLNDLNLNDKSARIIELEKFK